jgi:hypothetical protein
VSGGQQEGCGDAVGETGFLLRDILFRIGVRTLEATVNARRKKGGTQEALYGRSYQPGVSAFEKRNRRLLPSCYRLSDGTSAFSACVSGFLAGASVFFTCVSA